MTHVLLGMIGYMIESYLFKDAADPDRWFFFERTLENTEPEPTLDEHRAAIRFITRGE